MVAHSHSQFLCTSYVNEYPAGPLSITSIEDGSLRIVKVLYNTEAVRLKLAGGASVDDVLATLKVIQHTVTIIPIDHLKKVVWSDFSPDVVFKYHDGEKNKSAGTCVASESDKKQLLSAIGDAVTAPMRCYDELASVLSVAWSQIFGAVMALAGTIAVVVMWDPVRIARVRRGAWLLLFGRTGCAIIGVAIFVACCVSAWLAIRKRSRYFTCVFGDDEFVLQT